MKIKIRDRLIMFFGAVLTILSGAMLFIAGLQLQGMIADMALWARVVCIVCGLLLMAFGGYLFVFPRRLNAYRKDFVVQKTDTGELRIAVKAIENLVQKCIDLHDEIQVQDMKILNGREGVVVDLHVSLANNISIPMAIASLQKQIKQYLVASSGIEVREVRVIVESTKDEPLLVAEIEEEEENEPEKAPMHQRLFCQAEQQTIVPEPPKMEEEAVSDDNKPAPENATVQTEVQEDEP